MKCLNLTGQRFGKLTVLTFKGRYNHQTWWHCKCDCGKDVVTSTNRLKNGQTKSCGCYNREMTKLKNTKHGSSNSPLYKVWRGMINRCKYPGTKNYDRYGGRGIRVWEEWENSFDLFSKWAIQNGYSEKLTIDRIDNDGNYTPQNCRWVSWKVQARNRSNNHLLELNGVNKPLTEWAEQYNIDYAIVRERINNLGWNVEEAITTPKLNYWNTRRKHQ